MPGFGEILREARERRGLSLDEVEWATKIRRQYLEALEKEDYTQLPAPVFGRGFLRKYAHYLGLNVEEILVLYPQEAGGPTIRFPAELPRPTPPIGAWLVATVVLLLAVAGGYYLYQKGTDSEARPAGIVIEIPTATATPFRLPTSTPTQTPSPTPPPLTPTPIRPTPTPVPPTPTKPIQVTLPSLVGMSAIQAQSTLQELGLKMSRSDQWNANVAVGFIFAQDPPAGAQVTPGAVVQVTVSKGREKAIVPQVWGKTEQEARRMIEEAKLRLNPFINYQGHDVLPDSELRRVCVGCVLSVTPAPGTELEIGTEIHMAVRKD